MKIEITPDHFSGIEEYNIHDTASKRFLTKLGMSPRNFGINDIQSLLTAKEFELFRNGKYTFEITKKRLSALDDYYYKPNY